ncbi:hypothetical protein KJ359_002843 [Pestalotiopsis sp. 9143b]|nr:hypothetical protein KJ359_002843 [Pestalotiopsis sp. 9143b]
MSAKFPRGDGWVAFGSGYIMHRSLMFVMYPGVKHGSVVVGPRTSSPGLSEGIPDFRVVDTSFNDGYSVANFICYACNRWDGNSLKVETENQPWIWATNVFQDHRSDDPNKHLERHNSYNWFSMDMTATQIHGASESFFPVIQDRVSIAAGTASDKGSGSTKSNAYLVHGILMAVAFGLIFPFGILAAVSDRWSSIRRHWMVQTVTSSVVLLGLGSALFTSFTRHGFLGLFGPHQILGCAIGLFFPCQLALGIRHHLLYVKSQQGPRTFAPPAWMKQYHKILGYTLYILGCTNVFFGIVMANESRTAAYMWALVLGVQVIIYFTVVSPFRKVDNSVKSGSGPVYQPVNSMEEMVPFSEEAGAGTRRN